MGIIGELKRRNVFKVTVAYVVVGWVVLQVAETIAPIMNLPDQISQYILFFLIAGLPITIFFSWVYELTPEGVKKQSEVDREISITVGTGRKIDFLIIGGLILAIGGLIYERDELNGIDEGSMAQGENSQTIAVLPFADMSAAKDQEYFGDGIAEEILNVLVKVEGLEVTSRTSAFSLKGKGLTIPEMAKVLDVKYIVEGSIRNAGNSVRVTAQLIEVENDKHLWSETYDRKLDDIFAIQDEISQAISKALKVKLIGGADIENRPTKNLEAYQLYLQGRQLILQRGLANLNIGTDLLERTVALDPNFTEAWANLATGLVLIPVYDLESDRKTELFRGGVAADKALSLDPNSAQAWAAKGWFYQFNLLWAESRNAFEKAIVLNPNNEIGFLWLGYHFISTGYTKEGLITLKKALKITPKSGVLHGLIARAHLALGDFDNALISSDMALSQGWTSSYQVRTNIFLNQGKHKEALTNLKKWFELGQGGYGRDGAMYSNDNLEVYIAAFIDPSKVDQARKLIQKDVNEGHFTQAYWGSLLINDEKQYVLTAKRINSDPSFAIGHLWYVHSRPLLNKKAVKRLLKSLGLVSYWKNYGWPDYCRAGGEDDFVCDLGK